jgi:hypothetical protein
LGRFRRRNATLQRSCDCKSGEDNEKKDAPARNARLLFTDGFHAVRLLNLSRGPIPRV